MAKSRLKVELPVCRDCGTVGKMPTSLALSRIKNYCRGPVDAPHRKRKMETVLFVEAASK